MIPTKPSPTLKDLDGWSPEFHDFIARCLIKSPEERPSATAMLKHKLFSGVWCVGGGVCVCVCVCVCVRACVHKCITNVGRVCVTVHVWGLCNILTAGVDLYTSLVYT